jgi:hypothetical protein
MTSLAASGKVVDDGPSPHERKMVLDRARTGLVLKANANPCIGSADQYSDLLHRLPPDLDLDQLARQTRAIE